MNPNDASPILLFAAIAALTACATPQRATEPLPPRDVLEREVADTERAFAKTMADRDHARFATFVSEEAIFFSGDEALRGKKAVVDAWARLYQDPQPPFSWEPDQVQVLDSGTLALSTGPVRAPSGKVIARFNSIWRREAPGVWRVVFDKGCAACPAPPKPVGAHVEPAEFHDPGCESEPHLVENPQP